MFQAMQNGKAGRTTSGLEAGAPVRDLFRHTEDFLTSTVFERLAYLRGPVAWELLCKTFPTLPVRKTVEIRSVEFWPRWPVNAGQSEAGKIESFEPDIVFTLDLGDPPRPTLLILEVKTAGAQQVRQWKNQLGAAIAFEDHEGLDIIYAALGGLDGVDAPGLWSQVPGDLRERATFAYAGWRDFGRAVATMNLRSSNEKRLLEDIEQALALYRYRVTLLNKALFDLPSLRSPLASLATLAPRKLS